METFPEKEPGKKSNKGLLKGVLGYLISKMWGCYFAQFLNNLPCREIPIVLPGIVIRNWASMSIYIPDGHVPEGQLPCSFSDVSGTGILVGPALCKDYQANY